MQTFLPYADFRKSAAALDNRRLNKQLVEVQQIIKAIDDSSYGWQNHPAVNMWRNHMIYLCEYGMACYEEWFMRKGEVGATHKSGEFILTRLLDEQEFLVDMAMPAPPIWLGNDKFHKSHKSNLVRKDAEYYGFQFQGVPDNLEYVWPI